MSTYRGGVLIETWALPGSFADEWYHQCEAPLSLIIASSGG